VISLSRPMGRPKRARLVADSSAAAHLNQERGDDGELEEKRGKVLEILRISEKLEDLLDGERQRQLFRRLVDFHWPVLAIKNHTRSAELLSLAIVSTSRPGSQEHVHPNVQLRAGELPHGFHRQ
jgi:hypothetical protein